jgi:pyruvate/2-oxoglutarate dehydrogenase complex dihydrolipoamide acyltransferase (E2) component
VTRGDMIDTVTVVGNLIGAATVDAVPRAAGRLQDVYVKMGDRVRIGQRLAKIEDREILEQVKQAEASYAVSQATIRQRQADLKLALNNLERSRSLFERDLLPRQTFDDTESRYQASQAQLDLAQAQMEQSRARLDELKINLANTIISARLTDSSASAPWIQAQAWAPTLHLFRCRHPHGRLVINVVEKDLRRIAAGTPSKSKSTPIPARRSQERSRVCADSRSGDTQPRRSRSRFESNVPAESRVCTRAQNSPSRSIARPGVPTLAVVGRPGKNRRVPPERDTANFHPVTIGIEHQDITEIV